MFFKCSDLFFKFFNDEILKGINIEINKGEFIGLVGDNGSGKSTLMKLLSGIYFPYKGDIIFNNEKINTQNKIKLGYIFQNPENQIVGVTVEEDVAFGLENIGYPQNDMINRIKWALSITGLIGLEKTDPNTLSGGQKQRLAIASILAMDPEIIFMDEPTTMLDPIGRREVYSIIKKLNNLNKTIVIASHHSDDLKEVDRIIALKKGKIIFDGKRDIFYNKNDLNIEIPIEYLLKILYNDKYNETVKRICQ